LLCLLCNSNETDREFDGSDADLATLLREKLAESKAGEYLDKRSNLLISHSHCCFCYFLQFIIAAQVKQPEDLLTRFMKYYFPTKDDNDIAHDSSPAPAVAVTGKRTEPVKSQLQSAQQPVRPPLPHSPPEQPSLSFTELPDIVHQASEASESPESPDISWINTEPPSQLRKRRTAVRSPRPPKREDLKYHL
jgi:hypothetical protein